MEKFKYVPGFENYLVSDRGRVFSFRSKRFLKLETFKGYKRVMVYKDREKKRFRIHRLVAMVFLEDRSNEPGIVINHKNGIKGDNRVENLEWVTQRENIAHAMENNLLNSREAGVSKLNYPTAQYIRQALKDGMSVNRLAALYGVREHNIRDIKNNRTYSEESYNGFMRAEKIRMLRLKYNVSGPALAKRFGMVKSSIYSILYHRVYKREKFLCEEDILKLEQLEEEISQDIRYRRDDTIVMN